jgi:competence transcription factor ComK
MVGGLRLLDLLNNCLIKSHFGLPFDITEGNFTSHGDIFEGKVLMLMRWSFKISNIVATSASNCCYVGQAKHNTAMTTISEQPANLLSHFNTMYSTPTTLEVANNSWIPTIQLL